MSNPVMIVRPTSLHTDHDNPVTWRTCWMWCPGCDHAVAIPIVGVDGSQPDGPRWEWDGNVEAPTFSPSILQHPSGNIPLCHSFIKAGRWEFLSDSTHDLAGQTVDMVPLPDWLVTEGQ